MTGDPGDTTRPSARATYIEYTHVGEVRRGSGIHIGDTYILTAGHCAPGDDIQVRVDGNLSAAIVVWRSDNDDVDLAILDAADLEPVATLGFARLSDDSDARVPAVAYGFPHWKGQHVADTDGHIPLAERQHAFDGHQDWSGTYRITQPPTDAPPLTGDTVKTGWAGFSGTAVLHPDSGHVLGVIRGHILQAGTGNLTMTPVHAIDLLQPDSKARFCEILGIGLPDTWVVAGTPPRQGLSVGPIPLYPRGYIERPQVISLIEQLNATAGVSVVYALSGMRGVGKTQVAAAVARDCRSRGWDLVGWINAESADTILTDLAVVADALGVADPDGNPQGSAERLRNHLSSGSGRNLLVFDNATDPDTLRGYLPSGSTRTLITTTDKGFAHYGDSGNHVELGVYDRDQSIAYLDTVTALADPVGADMLAENLGDLALALAAAAATIARRRYTYDKYSTILADYPLSSALKRTPGQDYPGCAVEALSLAVDTLEPLSQHIAGVVAVLAPDGVDQCILLALATTSEDIDELDVEDAIDDLCGLSLLTYTDDNTLVMHRLTARVIRERGTPAQLTDAIADASAALWHVFPDSADTWSQRAFGAHLTPHIEALSNRVQMSDQPTDLSKILFPLRMWVVNNRRECADLATAIRAGTRLVTDSERVLGAGNPDTLTYRNELAGAYMSAGRLTEAIALYEDTLTDREHVLGADHPDTLNSRNNLAVAYSEAGRLTEAITRYEGILADSEHIFGPDNLITLATRNNLADAYSEAGRLTEAIAQFEVALADSDRILGPDHPITLTTRNNLAVAKRAGGDLTEAIALHEDTLTNRVHGLGADHPEVLATRSYLAGAYESAGRLAEAIIMYQDTLTDRERVLGPDHPDTLTTRNNLAGAYRAVGHLAEAITLYEDILADRERVLGPDHPDTLTSRNNLAEAYGAAGRLPEAITLHQDTLTDSERVLGPDHPNTLTTRNNLAGMYFQVGRLAEAITLYEETVSGCERVLRSDHSDTAITRDNLAAAYRAAGRDNDADRLLG